MAIPDILQQIVATKKEELVAARSAAPLEEVKAKALAAPTPRNFFAAMTRAPDGLVNIIAEIKKQSPSAGAFKTDENFDPVAIARIYHAAGADALSVLTDEKYFGGKLEYIQRVKDAVPLPVLRKDFIIDPYQVYEARAAGADAVLLIAEILTDSMMIDLQILAAELRLTTLIEVHEMDSLLRVRSTIGFPLRSYSLLGINNRDLRNFQVDLMTTLRLAEFVEDKQILVAESGIKDKSDVQRLASAGVRSLLIGETLMKSADIPQTLANLKGILRRA
jgi:indole-3-glycerol phosphate synthase